MKTLLLIIALVTSLCLVNCTPVERDGSITIIKVNGHKVTTCDVSKTSTQETIPISDLVENLEIIRMDDKDEAFFKAWVLTVTDNYIAVRQHGSAPFKLFDRKGNYLNDIGKGGNGPGEYNIALYDEIIDEKNKKIYLASFTGNKILVYGLDGKHIKDIVLPFNIQKPKMQLTPEGNLTVVHMPFSNDKYFAFQIDLEGNILKGIAPRSDIKVMSFDGELFSYRNSGFEVYHTNVDTLYHLDTNNLELIPVVTSKGREENSYSIYAELPDRYFFYLYNWETNESKTVTTRKGSEASSLVKLRNDYLGNLEANFNFNKGYFIENVEPGVLMEKIEKHLSSSTLTPQEEEKLTSLMNSLNDNQNNVLMIGKLKK